MSEHWVVKIVERLTEVREVHVSKDEFPTPEEAAESAYTSYVVCGLYDRGPVTNELIRDYMIDGEYYSPEDDK